jgi:hypothetical protein
MKKLLVAGVALAAVAIGFAAFAPGAGAQEDARVRVIHASPDAPNVDVYANGNEILSDVPFKTASDYLSVPGGTYEVEVFAAGADPEADAAVITASLPLEAGSAYTVVAVGEVAEIQGVVFEDDLSAAAAGEARVRVIHASPDAPAVDVAVTGGPVLFGNLSFPNASDAADVAAGSYDLEVRPAGSTDVALAVPGVAFEAGKYYTVLAVGLLNGDPALEALPVVVDLDAADPPAPPTDPGTPAPSPTVDTGVTAPQTGTGSSDEGSASWAMLAAIAAAGVAVAGAGAALAYRRNQ